MKSLGIDFISTNTTNASHFCVAISAEARPFFATPKSRPAVEPETKKETL